MAAAAEAEPAASARAFAGVPLPRGGPSYVAGSREVPWIRDQKRRSAEPWYPGLPPRPGGTAPADCCR
jgi:hypothetical protein